MKSGTSFQFRDSASLHLSLSLMSQRNLSDCNPVSSDLVGCPERSYEVVLYTDGHMMVVRKGVAEQIGTDGRNVK